MERSNHNFHRSPLITIHFVYLVQVSPLLLVQTMFQKSFIHLIYYFTTFIFDLTSIFCLYLLDLF